MIEITKVLPRNQKIAKVLLDRALTLELPFDDRQKSRQRVVLSNGEEAGLFLERGTVLRGGDVLVTNSGGFVQVVAAEEKVMLVRAKATSSNAALDLLRATYHLGNRHVPVQIAVDHLKLEVDHVLAEMLTGLGLAVLEQNAPFEPEGGAYDQVVDKPQAAHVHGPNCNHGHDHGHHHDQAETHAHPHAGHDHANCSHPSHQHESKTHQHQHQEHHGHDHSHDHGAHAHESKTKREPIRIHSHDHDHGHGPDCKHDH